MRAATFGMLGLTLASACSDAFRTADLAADDRSSDGAVMDSGATEVGAAGVTSSGKGGAPSGGGQGFGATAGSIGRGGSTGSSGARGVGGSSPYGGAPARADSALPRIGCSAATAGPHMALISTSTGAAYCIDETEVRVGDYIAFLASNPSLDLVPKGVCSFKKSFTPEGSWPLVGRDDYPITLVDWCDAAAYCAYAGKHLCGNVGGGSNAYADYAKPVDEWHYACTSGGRYTFPYGSAFDPLACVGIEFDGVSGFQPATDAPHPVGAAARCHSADPLFSALLDMAGNVSEWEDSCSSTSGAADYCHLRGDSYREGNQSNMVCGSAPRVTRAYRAGYIGFRCCMET